MQTRIDVKKYSSLTPSVGKLILLCKLQARKFTVTTSELRFLSNKIVISPTYRMCSDFLCKHNAGVLKNDMQLR
jgi:hypothetical protein